MNYSLEISEFTCTHTTFWNHFKATGANKKPRLKAELHSWKLSLGTTISFLVYFIFQFLHSPSLKVIVLPKWWIYSFSVYWNKQTPLTNNKYLDTAAQAVTTFSSLSSHLYCLAFTMNYSSVTRLWYLSSVNIRANWICSTWLHLCLEEKTVSMKYDS